MDVKNHFVHVMDLHVDNIYAIAIILLIVKL